MSTVNGVIDKLGLGFVKRYLVYASIAIFLFLVGTFVTFKGDIVVGDYTVYSSSSKLNTAQDFIVSSNWFTPVGISKWNNMEYDTIEVTRPYYGYRVTGKLFSKYADDVKAGKIVDIAPHEKLSIGDFVKYDAVDDALIRIPRSVFEQNYKKLIKK